MCRLHKGPAFLPTTLSSDMSREIKKLPASLQGRVQLPASKSLCNRALIIGALGGGMPENISEARDSRDLLHLLQRWEAGETHYDAGAGGTTYRFMLAFLATRPGRQFLTGSERMLQRPTGPLVDALRQMGARLEYAGRQGYPPLHIGPFAERAGDLVVRLSANVSSQYLTALLLVAPSLSVGLTLLPQGRLVSRPYVEMTVGLMRHFGAEVIEMPEGWKVPAHSAYRRRPYRVEADWTAASYFYALAALSEEADLLLPDLHENSLQGDSLLSEWMQAWGVESRFEQAGLRILKKRGTRPQPPAEMDFFHQPDLAQTFAVLAAAMGHPLRLTGLQTLRIKETDRLTALKNELQKTGVQVRIGGGEQPFLEIEGRARLYASRSGEQSQTPLFQTYDDHRMAMALSILAMRGDIRLENPEVVEKSFPRFFDGLFSV